MTQTVLFVRVVLSRCLDLENHGIVIPVGPLGELRDTGEGDSEVWKRHVVTGNEFGKGEVMFDAMGVDESQTLCGGELGDQFIEAVKLL